MAYDDEQPVANGGMHPALQALQDAFQQSPATASWANDAAVRINDFMTRRTLADENHAAGEAMVNNLASFKDGLTGLVQSDPTTTGLALDLVPGTIRGLVETHPNLPDDARQATHDTLVQHVQGEIARAAVTEMGNRTEPGARALLDNPRIGALLSDTDKAALSAHIDGMATARNADATAEQQQFMQDRVRAADNSAFRYVGALADPQTGDLQFPTGWAQRVMKDPDLPPVHSAVLLSMYNRFQQNGDPPQSDPFAAADAINRAVDGVPMLHALAGAGANLRLADALTIAGLSRPSSIEDQNHAEAVRGIAQNAKATLTAPEYGPAGDVAFGRFMNWFLPAVRGGADVNPDSTEYLLRGSGLQQFAPTANDGAKAILPPPAADRPSLAQIFGAARGRSR